MPGRINLCCGAKFVSISGTFFIRSFAVLLFVVFTLAGSQAVVLHPEGEPASDFSDINIPDTNVIGRYNSNASCVAIGRNIVITTAHQGGTSSSSKIRIAGRTYTFDKQWVCDDNSDIRIVKLKHANLSSYVNLNTSTLEARKSMVLGGYGKSRDEVLDYGYTWKSESNSTLRFGTNTIDGYKQSANDIQYFDLLYADFDELGVRGATEFECIAAEYDSGSGWFVLSDSEWKLAGLTYSVTRSGESWFDDPDKVGTNPDNMYAWRLSQFTSWINGVMEEQPDCPYVDTDLTDDCQINEDDIIKMANYWGCQDCGTSNNYCNGADLDQDGFVAIGDFARIATDWLNEYDSNGNVVTEEQ